MKDYSKAINEQYGQTGIITRILNSLKQAGKNLDALTLDDLTAFDQLHAGGREATRTLARMAKLEPGMQLLDIGSGLGGPARTLAADFGCQVTGIDVTEEFCNAAETLTAKVGLSDQVSFRRGSALDLPFEDASFDVVWTQYAIMNIEDKTKLFEEAHRVLKPQGTLALAALMSGSQTDIYYPLVWANDASVNFLSQPAELRQMMAAIGFGELIWKDITADVIKNADRQQATPPAEPPLLGIHLVIDNVAEKGANTLRCFKEGSIIGVQAVFIKS